MNRRSTAGAGVGIPFSRVPVAEAARRELEKASVVRRFRSLSNPSSPKHLRSSMPNVKLASLGAPSVSAAWPPAHVATSKVYYPL